MSRADDERDLLVRELLTMMIDYSDSLTTDRLRQMIALLRQWAGVKPPKPKLQLMKNQTKR